MNKKILPQSRPIRKPRVHVSAETKEFLADYHNFTNKWPTQRIAKLPEINLTRQAVYKMAEKKKEVHE